LTHADDINDGTLLSARSHKEIDKTDDDRLCRALDSDVMFDDNVSGTDEDMSSVNGEKIDAVAPEDNVALDDEFTGIKVTLSEHEY